MQTCGSRHSARCHGTGHCSNSTSVVWFDHSVHPDIHQIQHVTMRTGLLFPPPCSSVIFSLTRSSSKAASMRMRFVLSRQKNACAALKGTEGLWSEYTMERSLH